MRLQSSAGLAAVNLLFGFALSFPLAAHDQTQENHERREEKEHREKHHHYKLIDLGTFGGPSSYVSVDSKVFNHRGAVAGWADTSMRDPYAPGFCFNLDCYASHAFQWQEGELLDLGTLPGGSSSQAVWIASNGLIAGNSQNGRTDPLIPGLPETRAVIWNEGQINDLGTFGGNESIAYAVNKRGQVVGAALNSTPDPYSFIDRVFHGSSNGTQTRAFLWENGAKQDLGTLGTGTDALAFFVNEAGEVAGFSYTNLIPNPTTGLPTFHPFLWEKGKGMQDLGSFGGTAVQQVNGLNQRGQVVGSMTLPGDTTQHPFLWDGKKLIDLGTLGGDQGFGNWVNEIGDVVGQDALPGGQIFHGFLWRRGRMTDLGTLPGDLYSDTAVINSKGQIVGVSFTFASSHAVLWEHGRILDLNTLVGPGSALTLDNTFFINDRGEIVADGVLSNGDQHAVLLIPCDDDHLDVEGCDYSSFEQDSNARFRGAPVTQTNVSATLAYLPPAKRIAQFRSLMTGR